MSSLKADFAYILFMTIMLSNNDKLQDPKYVQKHTHKMILTTEKYKEM